jgi:hypothetical protein
MYDDFSSKGMINIIKSVYGAGGGLVAEGPIDVNLVDVPADRAGNVPEARFHGE